MNATRASTPRSASPPVRRSRTRQASQHARGAIMSCCVLVDGRPEQVAVDLTESPLAWLATRKGKDGSPLVSPVQVMAGERLRLDFTRAGLMPRVTTDWSLSGRTGGAGQGPEALTDMIIASKRRVQAALAAVGPELSGVLLDVCCFLKGLESVEQERGWPARTGKVVLGLGLDRLAAHYRLSSEARGAARAPLRGWRSDATPDANEGE